MTKKQTKQADVVDVEELTQQLGEAQAREQAAAEREKRAMADYQNLLKRQQADRALLINFASQELIEQLLQPVEHLSLAAKELDDEGLNMVTKDLWRVLSDAGLSEINPLGEEFNLDTMEVVDTDGDGQTVKKVVKPGYRLHDKVLQHAKVIVGWMSTAAI